MRYDAVPAVPDLFAYTTRFSSLWRRCASPASHDDGLTPVFATLRERYESYARHYHGAGHLAFCLGEFDAAAYLIREPLAVEMALWFHDAILDAGARDNELQSAELFRQFAGARMDASFVDTVARLILTTTHREPAASHDAQYLCDIDLASLGLPWHRFLDDCHALRAESVADDAVYNAGKLQFYDVLLHRPCIFGTAFFRSRHESTARDNMQRFMRDMQAGRIRWHATDADVPTATARYPR